MNKLSRDEKLELVTKIAEENKVTAYEIAKGTGLSEMGVLNILQKKSKRPHVSTLNEILNYFKNNRVISDNSDNYNLHRKTASVSDPEAVYDISNKIIAGMIRDLGFSINKHHEAFADGINKIYLNTEDLKDGNLLINKSVDRLIASLGTARKS